MIEFIRKNKDLALIFGVVLILITLFSPIPAVLLDLAIVINFGFALTILLLTFYVQKPVEFSTFPSLLLIATLFRLSLNVAATRLILTEGDAGAVIGSIGEFAVGGFFIVGLVVFFILVVVQYVVVTSGAQRVSEVAARFMLDSMPGQQMSIDADLNMGTIDQDEARARREALDKEASFYGAMDGASKFVKGDAIAGIIIILIDIIAGLIIGVVQMGMTWGESLQRFTLLTIGDGIATQLPALIIAIATGIIVTRSSSDRDLSTEVFKQLTLVPRIPLIVGVILSALLLLPGMPKWPIVILLVLTGVAWWRMRQADSRNQAEQSADLEDADDGGEDASTQTTAVVAVALGEALTSAWRDQKALITDRIGALRRTHGAQFGIGFPAVKLIDDTGLRPTEYEVRLFGVRHTSGSLQPGKMLAIETDKVSRRLEGIETNDPTFGLKAVWIEDDQVEDAAAAGYTPVDPLTVFITHLGEVLKAEAASLLYRARVVALLDDVRTRQPGLVEELVPTQLSISDVQRILQNLLEESVPVSNMDLLLEHLVDIARTEKDVSRLTEQLRQRIGNIICSALRDRHSDLAVLSLDPRVENQIQTAVASSANPNALALDPRLADKLLRQLATKSEEMFRQGRHPVLLCGAEIRRQIRSLTARSIPRIAVVSVNEIPRTIELSSFAVVKVEADAVPQTHPQAELQSH